MCELQMIGVNQTLSGCALQIRKQARILKIAKRIATINRYKVEYDEVSSSSRKYNINDMMTVTIIKVPAGISFKRDFAIIVS